MMVTFKPTEYCRVPPDTTARLLVVVDTEEEFDWSRDFARANDSVRAIRCIDRFQRICDDYRITPVYVVDFPVASQSDGYRPLQDIYKSRRCFIGAHLHPWVNPPFEEEVNRYNSFPGNLSPSLEARKLHILGDLIGERFGGRPVIYKAGRYGVGANTAEILEDQGYEVDVSFCPYMNYSAEGGPDFSHVPVQPFWFGEQRRLLEIPLSVGFVGGLRTLGKLLAEPCVSGSFEDNCISEQCSRDPDCLIEFGSLLRDIPLPRTSRFCARSTETGCGCFRLLYIALR